MLSMQDINASLKENFQRQLQEITSLPEDLALGYKNWVQGLVKQAAQVIQAEANPAPQDTADMQPGESE